MASALKLTMTLRSTIVAATKARAARTMPAAIFFRGLEDGKKER